MKLLTIAWHILLVAFVVFWLAIITPKVTANLTDTSGRETMWPILWAGAFQGIFLASAILVTALALSRLFAGALGFAGRLVASALITVTISAWIYSAVLMSNHMSAVMPTPVGSEMLRSDGALFAIVAIVFLAVPAISGRGVYSLIQSVMSRSNGHNRSAMDKPDPASS